jgi:hypothetical protein
MNRVAVGLRSIMAVSLISVITEITEISVVVNARDRPVV